MASKFQRIAPFLWFDGQAEEAVSFYVAIFDNSRIVSTNRYSNEGARASGQPEGSVMTVAFELDGQQFIALNGGAHYKFNEAISLVINCQSQEEVDHYWNHLTAGGDEKAQMCGWLKDRYGVSWQVIPALLPELLNDPNPDKSRRAMAAMLEMKKIDIRALQQAAAS